jgi:hypothetical protein
VSNPQKRKGDAAEREVAGILTDLLGVKAQRALGAGRKEDVGDVFGIPDTVIQVAAHRDINEALRRKLPETVAQQGHAGATFGALFLRRTGGGFVVCMTPEQFATLWREAFACCADEAAASTPTVPETQPQSGASAAGGKTP